MRALLAQAYRGAGRKAEAIAMDEGTVRLGRARTAPPRNDQAGDDRLAQDYEAAGRWDDLIALRRGACEVAIAAVGPASLRAEECRSQLSQAYLLAGRVDEAIAVEDEALKLITAQFGADHPGALAGLEQPRRGPPPGRARHAGGRVGEQSLRLSSAKFGQRRPEDAHCPLQPGGALPRRRSRPGVLHDAPGRAVDRQVHRSPASGHDQGHEPPRRPPRGCRPLGRGRARGRRALAASEAKQPDNWVTFQTRACSAAAAGPGENRARPSLRSRRLRGAQGPPAPNPAGRPALVAEAAARIVRLYEARGDAEQAAPRREKLTAAGDLRPTRPRSEPQAQPGPGETPRPVSAR